MTRHKYIKTESQPNYQCPGGASHPPESEAATSSPRHDGSLRSRRKAKSDPRAEALHKVRNQAVRLGKSCKGGVKKAERLLRAESLVYSHLITAAAIQENVIPTFKRRHGGGKKKPDSVEGPRAEDGERPSDPTGSPVWLQQRSCTLVSWDVDYRPLLVD